MIIKGKHERREGFARRAGVFAIGCVILALSSTSAAAGFFDFLFSSFPPAAPAGPPAHFTPPRAHFEHRHRAHSGQKKARRVIEARIPRALTQERIDLMDDDSLKEGDAVMMEGGIRIFVGAEGPHHRAGDFAGISESETLSRRQRGALLAIDPGREGQVARPALVTGRSAADQGLSAGAMIVDPRGKKIRYVGP
jgi:hypothetical protein